MIPSEDRELCYGIIPMDVPLLFINPLSSVCLALFWSSQALCSLIITIRGLKAHGHHGKRSAVDCSME